MQQIIFGPPLFYDIPEYLQIVSNHTFWQVFSLGHFPIHPIFLGILWIFTKIMPVNAIAMFFGVISLVIFYKISKSFLATLIFALFPAVWLINTNLMVESVTLTFYLASIYFFLLKRKNLFLVFLFLMIGTHLESIIWIPTLFLFPAIFNLKFTNAEIVKSIKLAVLAIFISLGFYFALYYFSGRTLSGATEQITTYFSSGILRMIRNSWLSFIRNFGSITPFIFLFVLIKNVKSKAVWFVWILFFGLVGVIGANWQGDFMGRRIIFAGVLLALTIYKYLGKKSAYIILYLLPIVVANILLYSKGDPFIIPQIPTKQVLIETHYLKPFTNYDGTILWIGGDDLGKIDDFLKSGKRVFLASQAVVAPYRLLVGNNYHITSLGRVGESESRLLFKKYKMSKYNSVYELSGYTDKISPNAGEPVIFYAQSGAHDQSFWGRLARRRIDYGDVGSWIWAIVTNHHDPAGWTYKDVRGIWYNI